MTLIERIDADPFQFLSAMIRARPRHQRSIDAPLAAKQLLPRIRSG